VQSPPAERRVAVDGRHGRVLGEGVADVDEPAAVVAVDPHVDRGAAVPESVGGQLLAAQGSLSAITDQPFAVHDLTDWDEPDTDS
jgi:hypothetical protein